MPSFDVAIIGLGVMGSAALAALARRGRRVVGIDRFAPAHDRGSSHGTTRVIRLGYFEHPSYVPLVRAAYPLWRELEARSGQSLMTITGIVEIGAPASDLVAGTLRSSQFHGLPYEILDARRLMKRFPAFRLPDDFVGVFQPDGGFVRAEPAVAALQALASRSGAELIWNEPVLAVEPHRDGVGDDRARRYSRRMRDRGRRTMAEGAAAATARAAPGDAPGARLVRAGRPRTPAVRG